MGRQSSRIYFQGKDHKDIYFQGHYHDKMYIGSQLVWEKLKEIQFSKIKLGANHIAYGNGIFLITENKNIYSSQNGIDYSLVGELPIANCGFINYYKGFFYLSFYYTNDLYKFYRTKDGTSFEEVTFYWNNLTGTLSDNKPYKVSSIYPLNDKIILYAGSYTDVSEEEQILPINFLPMDIYSAYESDDCINFYSKNILTRTYGNSNFYRIPMSISGRMMYKNGYYYGSGTKLDLPESEESDYSKPLSYISQYGIIKTSDFLICSVKEKSGSYIFYDDLCIVQKNKSLYYTEDFDNYIHICDLESSESIANNVSLQVNSNNIYAININNGTVQELWLWKKSENKLLKKIIEINGETINSLTSFGNLIINDEFIIFISSLVNTTDYVYVAKVELEE